VEVSIMTKYLAYPVFLLAATYAHAAEFEVASVKQISRPGERSRVDLSFVGTAGKPFRIEGNRVSIRGNLHALTLAAYDVMDYQITGGPAWESDLVYSIEAKTEGESVPSQDDVRPMLQALLADRFQLKLHRESKEMQVYNLVVARKSAALKTSGENETFSWNITPGENGTFRSKATKESIGDFVRLVGVSTDRPVIDKTGITGFIDYDILVTSQDVRNNDDLNRAIVDAVKDQLGLKLEPAKASITVLVIDRVEKASEN
jgi:uncharacterized protein (TIGR03435 family)